ncbi:Panacea domain-containing protein [Bosea sp. MMO-172]|uniref:Panacea domain-containing protein n=1 Tax=Bosea sp. MMO-172 TaxID=3127885 RepID=UPI00301A10AF
MQASLNEAPKYGASACTNPLFRLIRSLGASRAGRQRCQVNTFKVEKAAQVTAYFTLREDDSIDVLKVAKLVYLAERAYLDAYELPLIGDTLVAMPHGPVLSPTLDHVNSATPDNPEWKHYVGTRDHSAVKAAHGVSIDNLEHLSIAAIEVLDEVWAKYGHLDGFALRDLTHDECAEWTEPKGGLA